MANTTWTGDSGTWATAGEWDAGVPDTATNAVFNAGSFSTTGLTVSIGAQAYCLAMNWTGATNTPALAFGAGLNVGGDCTFIAAMSTSRTAGTMQMVATSPTVQLLTTNGLSLAFPIGLVTSGTTRQVDACTISYVGTGLLLTVGTWDCNGKALTTSGGGISVTGTTARVLLYSGAAITYKGTWNATNITNLTLTGDATSVLTGTGNNGSFIGGGATYPGTVNFTGTGWTISGNNVFTTLALVPTTAQTLKFTDGSTQAVTAISLSGDIDHRHTLQGTSTAGWTLSSAGALTADYVKISYCTFTGGGTFVAGPHAIDGGGNTGITFTSSVESMGAASRRLAHRRDVIYS